MSEEVEVSGSSEQSNESVEVKPAATPENVASTTEQTAGEVGEETVKQVPKTLTQAEVDDIVKKEKAKAEARAERRANRFYQEALQRLTPPRAQSAEPEANDGRPRQSDFEDVDTYVAAVAEWTIQKRERAALEQRATVYQQNIAEKTESIYQKAAAIDGFDREVFDELPLTPAIAAAITESEVAPDLMAFMARNPDDVARIARLHPARQAAEMGKLEVKMERQAAEAAAALKATLESKAPDPITPLGGKKAGTKNPAEMSDAEYAKWRKSGTG